MTSPSLRPYALLLALALLFALVDQGQGRFVSRATVFSVLQQFATLGPFALALGLSMLLREFDLSIAGMLSLGGCVAVLAGQQHAGLGLLAALALGLAGGLANGVLMVRLGLSSVSVTLGSLLVLGGAAYVVTGNQVIGLDNRAATQWINTPWAQVFSPRSVLALAAFAVAAVVLHFTRWGRDVVATGSDRAAARVAGVRVDAVVVAVFALGGLLSAGAGGLLSVSLGAASPVALAQVLIPAAAAAIMGGVSLAGGRGTPLGIAGGVLLLALLRSGLTALGAPPYLQDLLTGALLLTVALADAPGWRWRWRRAAPA